MLENGSFVQTDDGFNHRDDGFLTNGGAFDHEDIAHGTEERGAGKHEDETFDDHRNATMAATSNQMEEGEIGVEEDARGEELTSEVATISRQAKKELDKTIGETKELAESLFGELHSFLQEAIEIQKDFTQVQMTVHAESSRLDGLQPQVENATRNFASMN